MYQESDDNEDHHLVAETSSHLVTRDYMHIAPFQLHDDFQPSMSVQLIDKLTWLVKGSMGVVFFRVQGLIAGVQVLFICVL